MVAETGHVIDHALSIVGDGQPVDVLTLGRTRAGSHITETVGAELGRLETAGQQSRITVSVKNSMPQSVWWMTNHSLVPRSL